MILPGLQLAFQRYLLFGETDVERAIVGTDTLDAKARLNVYAEAYRLRLIEALETDFTALRAYLGEEGFESLARAYIDAHPSKHFSLRYFGRQMAKFLAVTPPYADLPLLAELAAFDWALTDAFDAEDNALATIEELAAIPAADWPSLRFRPHASLQRLDLRWNAPAVWSAAERKEPALPEARRADHSVAWVVWRKDLSSYFRSMTVDEAYALDALRRGEDFAAICEGLCEWIDAQNVGLHAATLLKTWVTEGMIRSLTAAQ